MKHNWFFSRNKSMGEGMGGKSEFVRFIESQKHETESWSEGSGIDLVDRTEKGRLELIGAFEGKCYPMSGGKNWDVQL